MINKWKSLALCLFLGWLGAHRFYEGKYKTGILYLFSFGVFGIGWASDLFTLLLKPNKHITESYQYNTYLKVVEALQNSGYTIKEYRLEWCLIESAVYRDSECCGFLFAVADPKPGILSNIIGFFVPKYLGFRYEFTEHYDRSLALEHNEYHYWPEGSLVGGDASVGGTPTKDSGWLNILKSVIG